MSEQFEKLNKKHIEFIQAQHLYFVATAAQSGTVNLSPKGMDSFKVINEQEVVWLNVTGSGNETAAHLLKDSRMTVMFCSFDKQPLILRLFGKALAIHPRDKAWQDYIEQFPALPGVRQFFKMKIDMVQTSCGYAVPYYKYEGERETLNSWAEKKGRAGIENYWADKNTISIDGYPTEVLKKD
ncbi:MAG: pyridoxamine 5'-phosphate oxidase family protein [Gammaproteobacteria bacterium]|nr:pyridoxamine 5'-phosphate oxidase family protein [Gammaproteobacteria bacterium]